MKESPLVPARKPPQVGLAGIQLCLQDPRALRTAGGHRERKKREEWMALQWEVVGAGGVVVGWKEGVVREWEAL